MDIKSSTSGKVIKTTTGYSYFEPNKLPPKIEWNNQLINALSRADYIMGKLSREASKLASPQLLLRTFVTREAVLSSKIEGTQVTINEMLVDEAGGSVRRSADELQEVKNYIVALDYGIKRLNELPLSLRLIREIHEKLMYGVRGKHALPGEFRSSQNWIGTAGSTIMTSKYVPPAPEVLLSTLGEFELFLHDKQLPALIHIALCHYQFEAIHPFLDGNGRLGRLLITLLLIERNILPSPLLYLSAFFEATKNDYYRHLYNVSADGQWNDWLMYFLNGIAVQSADTLSRAERINNLICEWQILVGSSLSKLPLDIVKILAINPLITINNIAQQFTVAFTTAQRAIKKLEDLGIITQVKENKRDRMYCASKILSILEEEANLTTD